MSRNNNKACSMILWISEWISVLFLNYLPTIILQWHIQHQHDNIITLKSICHILIFFRKFQADIISVEIWYGKPSTLEDFRNRIYDACLPNIYPIICICIYYIFATIMSRVRSKRERVREKCADNKLLWRRVKNAWQEHARDPNMYYNNEDKRI